MKKGILFMLLVLSTGVKAAGVQAIPNVAEGEDAPIVDTLSEDYMAGRVNGLWDAAVGLCLRTGTKDLPKCAQSNYEALEAASNEVVIND